jgi:hypothetical protein
VKREAEEDLGPPPTTLTVKGHFVVSGPDIEPLRFENKEEARDWCQEHHPGSPVTEVQRKPRGAASIVAGRSAGEGAFRVRLLPHVQTSRASSGEAGESQNWGRRRGDGRGEFDGEFRHPADRRSLQIARAARVEEGPFTWAHRSLWAYKDAQHR